jgi:hypothetical protein
MSAFFLSVYLASSLDFGRAMIMLRGSTTRAEEACGWSCAAALEAALYDAATGVSKRQLQN